MNKMLSHIVRGKRIRPRKTCFYGEHGLGKTTLASKMPDPLFLLTEDGLGDLEVPHLPVFTRFSSLERVLDELIDEPEPPCKTLVIDSADWLEKLIWEHICEKEKLKSIAALAYGEGYGMASRIFGDVLKMLDRLIGKGIAVTFTAHAKEYDFKHPNGESWKRFAPKLHHRVCDLLEEWVDELIFIENATRVKTQTEAFNQKRTVPIGSGNRVLHSRNTPTWHAKCRCSLPPTIPLDYELYSSYVSGEQSFKGDEGEEL